MARPNPTSLIDPDWETESTIATEERVEFLGMPGMGIFVPIFAFAVVFALTKNALIGLAVFVAVYVPFYFWLRGKPGHFLMFFVWQKIAPRIWRRQEL
jgi:hypothetical protein